VLHWGIIGALAMRLVFILAGAALLDAFHWMIYVFGAVLLVTAARLALQKEHEIHPERNPLIRLMRRFVPVTESYVGGKFFTRSTGVLMATPLFAVLLIVESTDLVFAIDSIPAIFAVTTDPYIVFTSNALAILGLRALYFALAGSMRELVYLRQGLVAVLAFVGVKMIVSGMYKIPTLASLAVIATILAMAIAASLIASRRAASQMDTATGQGLAPEAID
jgi:tellurite resistance protein TerC